MCRYGFSGPYKAHFACFVCRRAFKQPPLEDWNNAAHLMSAAHNPQELQRREEKLGVTLDELRADYTVGHLCPSCRQPMVDMGLDFKTPRQTDKKAWKILQGMYQSGHVFHTCGCDGPGYIPKSNPEYRRYLEQRRDLFARNLAVAQSSSENGSETRRESIEHWAQSLEKVTAAIAIVNG